MNLIEFIRWLEKNYVVKYKLAGVLRKFAPRAKTDSPESLIEEIFSPKYAKLWEKAERTNSGLLAIDFIESSFLETVANEKSARKLWKIYKNLNFFAMDEDRFYGLYKNGLNEAYRQEFSSDLEHIIKSFDLDVKMFKSLRRELQALYRVPLKANIIGIGEITTTIELKGDDRMVVRAGPKKKAITRAVKKMPQFPDEAAADRYIALMKESHRVLHSIGIDTPLWGTWKVVKPDCAIVYNWQERLPQESVGALVIHKVTNDEVLAFYRLIVHKIVGAFDYNLHNAEYIIGFDGQIPNWSVVGFDANNPRIRGDEQLLYFDTSTPLMRRKTGEKDGKAVYGKDLLDVELFLKSVPAPTRPIIRAFMMDEVLDRYYIPRQIITDVIASFYLYKRADMVPALVEETNALMKNSLSKYDLKPFTVEEMAKYHKNDTMLWVLFRALKRADRWITENILGKRYGQRLPKKKFTPGPFGET